MTDTESASPFQAPEPAELAQLFPDYEIQYLIATGGMGAVYHCIQKGLDRAVAIKILPKEFSDDAEFCESFAAEAKAMACLNHPNLIGVYDFGEAGGMLYIVMEYVPGQSLFDAAGGEALDPSEAMRLIIGTAEGLANAHEHGILHRDIKPANILLNSEAQPKIGDFGLASQLGMKVKEGEAIFGTPHYTAPEVINPPHRFDQKADIFSLGVMLHELLTGSLPADDPRPPSAICRCDPRLDAVVQKATHVNPSLRYSSAMEIAKALIKISTTDAPRALRTNAPDTVAEAGARPGGGAAWSPSSGNQMISQPKSGGGLLWFLAVVVLGVVMLFFWRPDLIETIMSSFAVEIEQHQDPQGGVPTDPNDNEPKPNKVFDMILPE